MIVKVLMSQESVLSLISLVPKDSVKPKRFVVSLFTRIPLLLLGGYVFLCGAYSTYIRSTVDRLWFQYYGQ